MESNTNDLQLMDVTNTTMLFTQILHKEYATANQIKSDDLMNYSKFEISYGNYSDYEFQQFIGKGASGNAYLGEQISTKQKVVIKTFKQLRQLSIKREIKLMLDVQGHTNISPLLDVITNQRQISLVFTRYVTVPTSQLFKTTNDQGNKYFLYQTLLALDYAHSKGIIHCDIKPANIITNPKTKMLKLIDWGLSQYYIPGKPKSTKVGTKSYKSPELLLGYQYYDYSTDIFSVGFMFSKMIFKQKNPFNQKKVDKNSNDTIYLQRIARITGMQQFKDYAKSLQIDHDFADIKEYPKRNLRDFINGNNKEYCSDEALDLLNQMLIVDHTRRITAKEAMLHPYFDTIRHQI